MTTTPRYFVIVSTTPDDSAVVTTEVQTYAGTLVSAIAKVQTGLEASRSDFSVNLERTMALEANRVYDFARMTDSALASAIATASEFPSRAQNLDALLSERARRAANPFGHDMFSPLRGSEWNA